jgi:hypothetical protein
MSIKDSKQTINSIINHWFKRANNIDSFEDDGDWTNSSKDTMVSIAKHWERIAKNKQ